MINIFIANLDWEVTSEDLEQTFGTFGTVTYAHVVYDRKTKRSMGFGYVEMEDSDQGVNAIKALNGLEVNGRPIDVKVASSKENRSFKKPASAAPKTQQKFDPRAKRDSGNRTSNNAGGNRVANGDSSNRTSNSLDASDRSRRPRTDNNK